MTAPLPWSRAWRQAARDFWSDAQPGDHFRTAAGPLLADRIADLVDEVDERLGHPEDFVVIDMGCGDAELLALVRERCPHLADRARWIGVDVRPVTQAGVESVVTEVPALLDIAPVRGVVMAHEWLDEIPCDVVERDGDGVDRLVLVDADGRELLGPSLADDSACADVGVDASAMKSWIERWWPLSEPGDRAEIGLARDDAWRWMCGLVTSGAALATDYGHVGTDRRDRHRGGTLAGYRAGALVRPSPDGMVNLTAHVALDACAHAVQGTTITRQRDVLESPALGAQPTAAEVEAYFAGLRLRDPRVWGDVGWLRWDA